MLRCSKRLMSLVGQDVQPASWLWASSDASHLLESLPLTSATLIDYKSYSCAAPQPPCNWLFQAKAREQSLVPATFIRSCFVSPEPRRRSMEFEDIMHKRRVFSKVVLRLTTRYKTRIRKLDFKEGIEADNAQQQLGIEYFNDVKDVVGRFRDDMDHVNAATVVHRMGCVAVCYPEKSWMVNGYKDILFDFTNFLLQPERLSILELRQAVMCYWGLASFGPSLMDLSLPQSPNKTVADCLRKLEDHLRTRDASLRNGNNVCNMIEAAALAQQSLKPETLEYLLTGAPGLLSDSGTSPQNVAGMLWGMSKLGLKDEWGAIPVAVDIVATRHNKLRMDEVAKIVKALADMDITDYGKFLEETVNRVQVAVNYSERQMSAQNVVDFAKGLAALNFSHHTPLMDYLVNDIKRRDVPLSYEQMEDFKKAAETLGYSLGSIDQEHAAEVA